MSTQKIDSQYNDVINKLHDYMLTENTIKRSLHSRINNSFENNTEKSNKISRQNIVPIKDKDKDKDKDKCNIFTPIQKDNLFWCFYILKYGYSNYEMEIYNKYFVVEKAEKFK